MREIRDWLDEEYKQLIMAYTIKGMCEMKKALIVWCGKRVMYKLECST